MLKMRLQRIGRRNDPSFRVIVADSRQGPKSGKHVDSIGSYNPRTGEIQIDGEKAVGWIKNGVQVSDTVHNMLIEKKIIEGKKINALPKKSPIVNEEAAAQATEVSEAAPENAETEAAETETDTEETASSDAPADTEAQEEVETEEIKATDPAPEDTEEATKDEGPAEDASQEIESTEEPTEAAPVEDDTSSDDASETDTQTEPEAAPEEKTDDAEETDDSAETEAEKK